MRGKIIIPAITGILILGSFASMSFVEDVFASTEVAKIMASDATSGDFFENVSILMATEQ
jgi:hypothetical protein